MIEGEEAKLHEDPAGRKARARAVFDQIADDDDQAGPGCFAHFGRRLVEHVGVEPGQHILDVATGRGAVRFPAAERIGDAGEAIGIDLAEEMVRIAAREASRRGLIARILTMDAERLDFPDAAFDRVLCGFGMMFFPHLDQALGECRRVLKPGGRIGVSTWQASQADDLETVLSDLQFLAPGDLLPLKEPVLVERALVDAGFLDVVVLADSAAFRYTDVEEYWQTARGTGLRRRLDGLAAVRHERAHALLNERLRDRQQPDGLHIVATALLAVASR